MIPGAKQRLGRYLLLFLGWTFLGLFFFSQGLAQKIITRDTHSGWDHLVSWMVGVWLWFLFTPLVFWAGRRFPLDRKPLWRSLVVHLPISLILPVVDLGIEAEILRSLHVFADFMATYTAAFGFLLIIGYHQGIITYWALLGARYGYGWYRRYEERRQEALRLELRWIVFIVKSLRAPLTMRVWESVCWHCCSRV